MNPEKLDHWLNKRREKLNNISSDKLFHQLISGDRTALSKCITIIESTRESDKKLAASLIKFALSHAGNSLRIGITGVPGVGKSTFIEAFGLHLVNLGKKVAVLAIDPSSAESGGSILGDKTRMNELAVHPNVFIRPSAAGSTLGGVAKNTRESVLLLETAGFDVILIETVGVGQSETYVHSMVDFFLLLMLSGAGDELQGIKRGIMEMADALVITKADGENEQKAKNAAHEYANAMHLFPPKKSKWIPKAFTCSSLQNKNIDVVWKAISDYDNLVKNNGWFAEHRRQQDKFWLKEALTEMILNDFFGNERFSSTLHQLENEVYEGKISSFQAAEDLYNLFKK